MAIFDWIIVALFLVGLIMIGFIFSRRNKNIEDYFVAGRSMPTWLVALAATGTSISAGTFVGSPELGFNTNITFIMSCIGAVIGGVFVAWLVLPKLYNAQTITIYGYIGDRFGETSKRATSIMFLLGQLFTSGSRLFIAAIAVSVMAFGTIDFQFIVYSIIILGIISTIYTMAGGIKGLLYIDAIQILLVVGTGVVALFVVYFQLDMDFSEIIARLRDGMVKVPAQNAEASAKWLAKVEKEKGVKKTASGLLYKINEQGNMNEKPNSVEDVVKVHYRGTTRTGKEFDSSYKRNSPIDFPLNGVIKGWGEGLQLVGKGGSITLWIPAELAYGSRGAGADIGPNEALRFDVELLDVTPAEK